MLVDAPPVNAMLFAAVVNAVTSREARSLNEIFVLAALENVIAAICVVSGPIAVKPAMAVISAIFCKRPQGSRWRHSMRSEIDTDVAEVGLSHTAGVVEEEHNICLRYHHIRAVPAAAFVDLQNYAHLLLNDVCAVATHV